MARSKEDICGTPGGDSQGRVQERMGVSAYELAKPIGIPGICVVLPGLSYWRSHISHPASTCPSRATIHLDSGESDRIVPIQWPILPPLLWDLGKSHRA